MQKISDTRLVSQIKKYLYMYKIKVLSVHWSKSCHILVAHVSSKVMNENTLNKIPVCLLVCLRGFREKLLTIHVKRDHYEISYLDQISSNLRSLPYNVLIF